MTENEVHTQAPIGPFDGAGLAATVALGRLLRLHPHADITSIRFTVEGSANPYSDDGPYVHAHATLHAGAHLVASEAFVVPDDDEHPAERQANGTRCPACLSADPGVRSYVAGMPCDDPGNWHNFDAAIGGTAAANFAAMEYLGRAE